MESLEKFIEKRMQQSEFQAMMIPRYLEKPNAFKGSKHYTLEQAEQMKKEAEKCKAVLDFLKDYNKKRKCTLCFGVKFDFHGFCEKCAKNINSN